MSAATDGLGPVRVRARIVAAVAVATEADAAV